MRIRNPETSEIAYLDDSFNLTDCEGNIIKTISLNELKKWQKYEEDIKITESEKNFVRACLDNLLEFKFENPTHILKDKNSIVFCMYKDSKIVYLENIQVKGFKELRENVVYNLKELNI